MSERKINLEELFNDNFNCYTSSIVNWKEVDEPAITKDKFKETILKVSKQLLELASKNAKIIDDPNSYCGNTGSEYPPDQIVSKQSILDTINQVE